MGENGHKQCYFIFAVSTFPGQSGMSKSKRVAEGCESACEPLGTVNLQCGLALPLLPETFFEEQGRSREDKKSIAFLALAICCSEIRVSMVSPSSSLSTIADCRVNKTRGIVDYTAHAHRFMPTEKVGLVRLEHSIEHRFLQHNWRVHDKPLCMANRKFQAKRKLICKCT